MSRSLPEWIGKTDDTPVPPRVKLRVFERHGGVCHISKRKIRGGEDWDCDHVVPLIEKSGGNRESNLAPALVEFHKQKTAGEVELKAKIARVRAKFLGIYPKPVRRLQGRGFQRRQTQSTGNE